MARQKNLLTALIEQDKKPRAVITQQGEVVVANTSWYELILSSPFIQCNNSVISLAGAYQKRFREGLSLHRSGCLVVPHKQAKIILEWTLLSGQQDLFELLLIAPDQELKVSFNRFQSLFDLSGAEKDVLFLLSKGLTGAEIAPCRNVSKETVRSQIKNLQQKTGSNSQNELISMLFNIGA